MSSPGGQNGEDQKNFARMGSPEHEEIPGDELEKELAGQR